jgi:hypothetical protein
MNRGAAPLLGYLKRQHHRDLSDDREIEIFHQLKDAFLDNKMLVGVLIIILM